MDLALVEEGVDLGPRSDRPLRDLAFAGLRWSLLLGHHGKLRSAKPTTL